MATYSFKNLLIDHFPNLSYKYLQVEFLVLGKLSGSPIFVKIIFKETKQLDLTLFQFSTSQIKRFARHLQTPRP